MNYREGKKRIALLVSKLTEETQSLEKIEYCFDYGLKLVGKAYLWRDLIREGEFVQTAKIDSGTVTVTRGSRIVSGIGTPFVSDMAGWFLTVGGRTYTIASSSGANSLILVSKAVESSSNSTYEAWQRYFQIHSDVRLILPNENSPDKETPFTIQGQKSVTKYNVPEVKITKDSNILTGIGSLFLDNVRNGDFIQVGARSYHVLSVNSNTEMIMTNFADEDLTSAASFLAETSYLADMKSPASEDVLVSYRYLKHLFSLVHDDDLTGFPNTFDDTILKFAMAEFKRITNLANWLQDLQIAQLSLDTLKDNSNLVIEPYYMFPPKIYNGMGRGSSRR